MAKMTAAQKLAEAKASVRAEARRKVAAKRKSSSQKKSTARKAPSLGSGLAGRAQKAIGGRRRQIDAAVKKATGR